MKEAIHKLENNPTSLFAASDLAIGALRALSRSWNQLPLDRVSLISLTTPSSTKQVYLFQASLSIPSEMGRAGMDFNKEVLHGRKIQPNPCWVPD